MKPQRNRARDLGFYVLIMVICSPSCTAWWPPRTEQVIYSDVVELFRSEQVESLLHRGLNDRPHAARTPQPGDAPVTYRALRRGLFWSDMRDLIMQQHEDGHNHQL